MITQFRRKLKSRAARNIILWIVLGTLSLGFISTIFIRMFKLDKGAGGSFATINGSELSTEMLRMKIHENEQRIQMLRKYFGQDAEKLLKQMDIASDPKNAALQASVNQELINQLANRLSVKLSADFVDRKFSDKSFLQSEFGLIDFDQIIDPATGILDSDKLGYYLRMLGLSGDAFKEILLNSLKREILTEIASNAYYIPEFELRQKYIKDCMSKKFSILKFDFSSFEAEARKVKVGKEELRSFYDSENGRNKRYWVPEKRSGVAYYFDANSYGVVLKEEDIKRYYDDNKISMFVKDPAKVQVRRILFKDPVEGAKKAKDIHSKLLLDPASFSNIAKELSDDKVSAKNGGLMPMTARGQRDEEFEKVAFSLKQDNNISDVVKTKEGYEILQRVKREEINYKPLAEVAGQIKEKLLLSEFKKIFSNDMNKNLSSNNFNDNKFNDLLKRSIKSEKIEPKVFSDDKISGALFRIRDGAPAYYLDGTNGVVVKLDSVQAGHLPELSTVEDTVSGDYYEKMASNQLNTLIKDAALKAKTGDIEQLAKTYKDKYKVEVLNTGFIREDNEEKIKEFRSKGYPVEKIFKLETVGSTNYYRGNSEETANGYVAKLQELEPFNDKQYLEKKLELEKEAVKLKNMAHLEEFIAFLRKKAIIKVNK